MVLRNLVKRGLFTATLIIAAAGISGCLSPNSNFSAWCLSGQNCSSNDTTIASSSITASPTLAEADGAGSSTLTITFLDSSGNPIIGQTASLTSSRGAQDTITTISGTTNSAGKASFSILSSTTGTPTLTATTASASVSGAPITFTTPVANSSLSYFSTPTSPIHADGVTTSTVQVTLLDSNSIRLPNRTVTLSSSRGSNDVITPASAMTNSSGMATFTVSSQHFGASTYTATDTTDSVSVSGSVLVTFQGYRLMFSTEPASTATTSTNLSPSPIVSVEDATGSIDNSIGTGSVSLMAYMDSACGTSTGGWSASGGAIAAGQAPFSNLQFTAAGFYYLGATSGTYTSACSGEIKIGPSESVLHSFVGGSSDGANPMGALVLSGSTLYGMTYQGGGSGCSGSGCGTLFSIADTGGTMTLLHSFGGAPDGALPMGNLALSGSTLYGMTSGGGTNGDGLLFSWASSSLSSLHSFAAGSDGQYPQSSLTYNGTTFYGTTKLGGTSSLGTIFSSTTAGAEAVVYSFTGGTDGSEPTGTLVVSGTTLYGMTLKGGGSGCGGPGCGTIFSESTSGGAPTILHSFVGGTTDGASPSGGLIDTGSVLYGLTPSGGASNQGTIFSINTNGTGFTILHSFANNTTDGGVPLGSLILSGTTLYGTASQAGSGSSGTIFSIGTNRSGYTTLYNFQGGTDGRDPEGDLILSGSTLYGMTYMGGPSNLGTIFSF